MPKREPLTDAEVREIQRLLKDGARVNYLAAKYRVNSKVIYNIKNGVRIPYDPNLIKPRNPLPPAKTPGVRKRKLTDDQVRAIRKQIPHKTLRAIAKEFNVTAPTIAAIRDGIIFRDVK